MADRRRKQERLLIDRARAARDALGEALARLPELLARDRERAGRDGYPTGSGGRRSNEVARPTESVAIQRKEKGEPPDPYHTHMSNLARLCNEAARAAAGIRMELAHIDRLAILPPPQGAAECANQRCKALVTGVAEDRLRAGRCPRCYRWRLRHGGEDWRPGVEDAA